MSKVPFWWFRSDRQSLAALPRRPTPVDHRLPSGMREYVREPDRQRAPTSAHCGTSWSRRRSSISTRRRPPIRRPAGAESRDPAARSSPRNQALRADDATSDAHSGRGAAARAGAGPRRPTRCRLGGCARPRGTTHGRRPDERRTADGTEDPGHGPGARPDHRVPRSTAVAPARRWIAWRPARSISSSGAWRGSTRRRRPRSTRSSSGWSRWRCCCRPAMR